MRGIGTVAGSVALGLWAGTGLAEEQMLVAGRKVAVMEDGIGAASLVVDGAVLHQDGVIYLDPEPRVVAGVTVITGAAGAGGNACNAAPFVVALADGTAPEFWGPVDSCAYFTPKLDGERVVFTSEAVPGAPAETWVWTRSAGLIPGPAVGFAADAGWEAFDGLDDAHPVEALAIAPVLTTLQAGLAAEYAIFAERISELGSGDLTGGGYLGQACLKYTCDDDWALLYIDRAAEQVFAAWRESGRSGPTLWPADRAIWPEAARRRLDEMSAGE